MFPKDIPNGIRNNNNTTENDMRAVLSLLFISYQWPCFIINRLERESYKEIYSTSIFHSINVNSCQKYAHKEFSANLLYDEIRGHIIR